MSAGRHPGRRPGRRPGQRFFVETWGCQMNDLDSQRLAGRLMQQGLLPTRSPEEADVILLNSCSVREKAEQKAYSRLGEYRLLKRRRPDLLIGFCGCVAQQEGRSALRKVPELDFVLGPGRIEELGQILGRARRGIKVVATGFPGSGLPGAPSPNSEPYNLEAISREGTHKGMVTVIEGCNKKCTFCIVPTTRGPERSRPLGEILHEVNHLVECGFLEIELLGQTVNHWRSQEGGGVELDFADLLEAAASRPGVRRLRFVTSYPRDFTPRMVEQIGRHANICPYVHLPIQSGCDKILRRMGRGYTVDDFRHLADDLRETRSDLALSTDIIVGFPGESEADFDQTLRLVEELRFSSMFAFKYSPRPGTPATRLDARVAPEVADRRLQELLELQSGIQHQLNRELVGRRMEILVTGPGKEPATYVGRSSCHRIIHFEPSGDSPPGSLLEVCITKAYPHSLLAVPLRGRRLQETPETAPGIAPRAQPPPGAAADARAVEAAAPQAGSWTELKGAATSKAHRIGSEGVE